MSGPRIAVVGVGAIGGSVAAALADRGGCELWLCARNPFPALVVEHVEGTSRLDAPVLIHPADATREVGSVD